MPVNTLFLISWFALPNKQTTKFLIHPHQRIISTKVPFVILLSSLRRPILGVSFTIKRLGWFLSSSESRTLIIFCCKGLWDIDKCSTHLNSLR
uniref:Uncharacterized protein n=1 Tax=Salix viminalis TaxID=40686 RepID=A0A6N2LQG2_SALVM